MEKERGETEANNDKLEKERGEAKANNDEMEKETEHIRKEDDTETGIELMSELDALAHCDSVGNTRQQRHIEFKQDQGLKNKPTTVTDMWILCFIFFS